jgi:hypothetical protein
MQTITKKISKREYLEYVSNPAAYNKERKEHIPTVWACGYGWYGCTCYESSNGQYYRDDRIGGSCD